MAYTKYTLASAALTSIGANPVVRFASTGNAETVACFYHWQPNVDHWLSIYPWRFATTERTLQIISYDPLGPPKKNEIGTSSASLIRWSRPAPMRFTPFSYLCTCWNVTPIRPASWVWLIPATLRRSRIRAPT